MHKNNELPLSRKILSNSHGLGTMLGLRRHLYRENKMYNKSSLHVLAATTGLGDQRIEELWEGADLYARAHAGNGDQARYQKILHERMAELVEREVAKRHVEPEIPWVIADAHLGLIYVSADDALKAFGSRGKQVLH